MKRVMNMITSGGTFLGEIYQSGTFRGGVYLEPSPELPDGDRSIVVAVLEQVEQHVRPVRPEKQDKISG